MYGKQNKGNLLTTCKWKFKITKNINGYLKAGSVTNEDCTGKYYGKC